MSQDKRESETADERIWEQGWEGHRLAQQRRMAKLTFPEKLQWLEEAHRVARQLQESRKSHQPQPPSNPNKTTRD
jgi:hypothetical protein